MFDTLKYVETLTSAGMPIEQAKACVEVQKEALEEAFDNNYGGLAIEKELIATRTDLRSEMAVLRSEIKAEIFEIKKDIAKLQVEMIYMRWMLGILILGVGSLVAKTFI